MKAIIRTKAGKEFSTMKMMDIESPRISDDEVIVKMVSSRINPVDMDLMKGFPMIKYKNPQIGGIDGAGTITEIGKNVKNFKVGDAVFFYRKFSDIGTWAEKISINATDCAKIPSTISTEQAGSIALPLLTAYESLQKLNAKNGESVLIHGAGGGVGFLAVQIAKKLGLKVIGTASEADFEKLKNAGVEKIINYKTEDFENVLSKKSVDYVFDTLGDETLKKSIRIQPKKVVSVKYVVPSEMYKVGVKPPAILSFLMKMMMGKFNKLAKKNGVQIIGQVTGANGKGLQQSADIFAQQNFTLNPYKTLSLKVIENSGIGKEDIGKVIVF